MSKARNNVFKEPIYKRIDYITWLSVLVIGYALIFKRGLFESSELWLFGGAIFGLSLAYILPKIIPNSPLRTPIMLIMAVILGLGLIYTQASNLIKPNEDKNVKMQLVKEREHKVE